MAEAVGQESARALSLSRCAHKEHTVFVINIYDRNPRVNPWRRGHITVSRLCVLSRLQEPRSIFMIGNIPLIYGWPSPRACASSLNECYIHRGTLAQALLYNIASIYGRNNRLNANTVRHSSGVCVSRKVNKLSPPPKNSASCVSCGQESRQIKRNFLIFCLSRDDQIKIVRCINVVQNYSVREWRNWDD